MNSYIKVTNPCPKTRADIFSKLTFRWLFGIFRKSLKSGLKVGDLYECMPSDNSKKLGDLLEKNWNVELQSGNKVKPSLLVAIRKTFFWSFVLNGISVFFYIGILRSIQPWLLAIFIGLFPTHQDATADKNEITLQMCLYGGLISLITFAFLFYHHTILNLSRIGMRVRIACCSLIYRKMLRLSRQTLNNSTSGKVVNLLSNDVSRFEAIAPVLHNLWVMPVQTALITYLLWQEVNVSALIGIGSLLITTIPIYVLSANFSYKLRLKIAANTDVRLKRMAEIISGIQAIKMYAWEKPFAKIVNAARVNEIRIVSWTHYIRGMTSSSAIFMEKISLGLTILSYVFCGHALTADKLFSVAFYYQMLQLSLTMYYPFATTMGAEVFASIKRLQEFMLLEEKNDSVIELNSSKSVTLRNIQASWEDKTKIFSNINLNVQPGTLCAIVGPVGAGKSAIFQLLMGELVPEQGTIEIGGEISYASQEPWIFSSTIRKNILFGQEYDPERYERVIESCALERDLQKLPHGDQTLVGEKGVILNGGQKARISLARAIYKNADIYLLDDPLSAVEPHVGNHLFQKCILGHLNNKTRILVTNQLQHLQKADHLVVVNNGKIEDQGRFEDLLKSSLYLIKLLPTTRNDTKEMKIPTVRKQYIMSMSTNDAKLRNGDAPRNARKLATKFSLLSYWEYVRSGGNKLVLFGLILTILSTQAMLNAIDLWGTYWTKREALLSICKNCWKPNNTSVTVQLHLNATKDYNKYFCKIHESNLPKGNVTCVEWFDPNFSTYVYMGLILSFAMLGIVRSFYFFKVAVNSSKNLHNKMFRALLQVPMRFFDSTPIEKIVYRVSSDMGIIDEALPNLIFNVLTRIFITTGILAMIFFTNPYMIIVAVLLAIIIYKFQRWHFRVAINLKNLESITRSPMFTHLSDSLYGITTIRASSIESVLIQEFDWHQDTHTSAWHLMICCGISFGWLMDVLNCIFIACVIFSFIIINQFQAVSDSMVGLAVSQSLLLTGLVQHSVKQATEVVTKMVSVERILDYTKLDEEDPRETNIDKKILKDWPSEGAIQFHQVYLRYSIQEDYALRNVNFTVKGGEKIGIVGPTGAGKSSLVAALFRLVPTDGFVTIDSIRTDMIGLNELRKRISIIPQDPILFSATLRYNLDPFDEYSDEDLWNALDAVELRSVVHSLDFKVEELGNNFSVGQKQLVCLARAILRKNKILVLDEATANVDSKTEATIQETITKQFSACTVLRIAHRLHTVMNSDKILVMDGGKLREFDHPLMLLRNSKGLLFEMVAQTGIHTDEELLKIADRVFLKSMDEKP